MRTYYHVTPLRRLARIKREGLGWGRGKAFTIETGTHQRRKRVYLSKRLEGIGDLFAQIAHSDEYDIPDEVYGKYAILEVRIPKGVKVRSDEDASYAMEGEYYYVNRWIPPEDIQVVGMLEQERPIFPGKFSSLEVRAEAPAQDLGSITTEYLFARGELEERDWPKGSWPEGSLLVRKKSWAPKNIVI